MKKVLLALLAFQLSIFNFQFAQAQTVSLNEGGYRSATFTVTTPNLLSTTQTVGNEKYAVLSFEGSTHLFRNGEPDLPVISQIVEVPLCADIEVTVSDVQTRSMNLASPVWNLSSTRLLPMQPAPSKSDKGPLPFVIDSALYATDAFYSAPEVAWVDVIGVARDRRLAALRISPVSYNPVTGRVQLITSLTVTLTYKGVDEAATRELRRRYYSPAFSLGENVLATLPNEKSVRSAAPLHYLVVAHGSFRGQLDNFVDWKRRLGMIVTVGYTDDPAVGTTSTAIANYIKGFYTNATDELPAPTYLLIVGDHEQIPAFSARCTSPDNDHITDLYYVTWDGDNIPDCYRGRFSAQNVAQLAPQLSKTLLYEGYNFTDPAFLSRGILIAGEDGGRQGDNAYTYADPTMDYVAKTYVNASNGFDIVRYYKNNTAFAPTGVTVSGSSQTSATATNLRTFYNSGYGWVNYSAHGSETSWATPELNTSQVAQMANAGKPGIFIGNCCLTGKFEVATCFGESLLRRGDNAGAVAYIGATNSTYWPHDFCWTVGLRSNISGTMNTSYDASHLGMYDRLFHTHNEDYTLWHNTLGSMVTAGNLAVEAYGSYQLYYWEIYQLFGDPSLIPWLGQAADMPFNGAAVVMAGNTEYAFTTAPRAYVAITSGESHELVAAAYADMHGQIALSLPTSLSPGSYEIAITAQGYKPLFVELSIVVPNGPYLTAIDIEPQSGFLLPGQANLFNVTVVNNGVSPAWAATLRAGATESGVVSLRPDRTLPTINEGDTVVIANAFSLYVPETYGYGDVVHAEVTMDFVDRTSSRIFPYPVSSPKLVVSNVSASGIDTGATATVCCTLSNVGDLPTEDLTLALTNLFNMVATAPESVHVGVLQPGQAADLTFTFVMTRDLPDCPVPFLLMAYTDADTVVLDNFLFNGPGAATETFEKGTFSLPWQQGTYAWEITTSDKHTGSYSARSRSNLSGRCTSELSLPWTSSVDDSITFWYKVSSEADYDIFTFYIDGTSMMEASGTSQTTFRRVSFPVAAGSHLFKFAYSKDRYATDGSDCAWIDDVTLPYAGTPTRFVYDTVCQGSEYSFGGNSVATDALGDFSYTDNEGTEIVHLALHVAGAPNVTITTSGDILQGGVAVLTAHGATSYVWSTGDSTASIVVSPDQTASYTVTGYRGGCSAQASVSVGVGVAQTPTDVSCRIYPNPTHGLVNVVCPEGRRATMVNTMGQVVGQFELHNSSFAIDLQNLPDGIYFLKVETLEGTIVKKIMKK